MPSDVDTEVAVAVEVVFEPIDASVMVPGGSTILQASEALQASETAGIDLLTGCTEGMCGTDAVQVIAGQDGLAEAAEPELGTLERMGLGPDYRLACTARVLRGSVHVRIDAF